MPKVLVVTTEAPDIMLGGVGFFNRLLWTELEKREYPFKTCYLNLQGTKPSLVADIVVTPKLVLPFDSNPESKALNISWTARELLKPILDDYQPDVISLHENGSILSFWPDMDRVQFTLHSSHVGLENYLVRTTQGLQAYWEQRFGVTKAKALILHSHWAERMTQQYLNEDVHATKIFPIGLNFEDYQGEKIPHAKGKVVISFFGRHTDSGKNFTAYMQAIATLSEKYKNQIEARLYSPTKADSSIERYGIKVMPFVQGEKKKIAYAETDIVVMPSIRESFGIVGLEALLSNCELIATPGLGMDEYMPKDCACPSNPEAIQTRIMAIVDEKEDLRAKQRANYFRDQVNKPEFLIEQMTSSYIEVWQEMLDKTVENK